MYHVFTIYQQLFYASYYYHHLYSVVPNSYISLILEDILLYNWFATSTMIAGNILILKNINLKF